MWEVVFSLIMLTGSIFQPILPSEIEKIDLQLDENEIAFTFFDLSNGESTLIQTAKGENILINTGASESEEELYYYLEIYGVSELTYLILTSSEKEYTGNAESILKSIKVGQIIIPNSLNSLLQLKKEAVRWNKNDKHQLVPGLRSQVLNAESSSEDRTGMDILFEFKGTYLLYMTSANKKVEELLIKENNLNVTNILKVADFGNRRGNSDKFLNECDPQVAILFKKAKSSDMMDVLERLHETWIDIYQTRQVGNITIKMEEKDYQVITLTLDSFHQSP